MSMYIYCFRDHNEENENGSWSKFPIEEKIPVCNENTISFISVLTKPIILCGRQHIRNKKDSTYREDQVYSAETR